MRIILNNVPLTTIEGDSVTITTSMSDPVPTCTLNVRDDTSSLSIQAMEELLIIDDQQIPNPTSNILVNPSLNPYTSAWSVTPATGMTPSQIGGGGVKITCANATPGGTNVLISASGGLQYFFVPGQTYMASVYVQGSSTPTNIAAYLQVNWYDAAFNNLHNDFFLGPNPVSTSLVRYQVQTTAPANAAFGEVVLGVQPNNATNSGAISFTQAQIEPMWFPNEIAYPSPWCGPSQTNCKQIPGSLTWIRQYRKFAGYINHAIAQNYHGNARQWQIDAVGYAWLCGQVLGTQNYSSQTDAFAINNMLNNFFTAQFLVSSNVITGVTLNNFQLNYDDPRTVIDGFCGLTGFFWGVDPYWEVYYQPPGYVTMPISLICDNSSQPDMITTFPAYGFSAEMDYTQPGSVILVIGNGSNVAEVIDPNVVSTFQNIQLYGNGGGKQFMRKVNDSTLNSVNDCIQRGIAELMTYDNPRMIYHLTTNVELKAGQGIALTSVTEGLTASTQLIQQVQAKWIGTSETLTDVWEYQADLGSVNRGATNIMSRLFRKGNQNTSAPAISTTALATFEHVGVTDTIDSNSAYALAILQDAPLRYFRLGEPAGFSITTAYDWSGNTQNGTLHGTVTLGTTGLLFNDPNTCMTFDGSTGYVDVPTTSLPTGAAAWTIECWCQVTSISLSYATLVTFGAASLNQLAEIHIKNNNFAIGTFGTDISGPANLVVGNTYHVAATWNGTTATLYVNGQAVATGTPAYNISLTDCRIAVRNDTLRFYPGAIDEVAIYGYALSAQRILTHYNIGTLGAVSSLYSSIILALVPSAYYRLGEPSGTTATDATTNGFNGTITGGVTLGQPGAIVNDSNDAMTLNGTTGYIALPGGLSPNGWTSITIEAWINLASQTFSNFPRVVSNDLAQSTNKGVDIDINTNGAGGFFVIGTGSSHTTLSWGTTFTAGLWYHLACVWDGSTMRAYVNGSQVASTALSGGSIGTNALPFNIGRNPNTAGAFFNGTIDEVAIYGNTALSAAQVLNHYNIGALGHS